MDTTMAMDGPPTDQTDGPDPDQTHHNDDAGWPLTTDRLDRRHDECDAAIAKNDAGTCVTHKPERKS